MKKSHGRRFGFWESVFPNQLGNLCFFIFLISLLLFFLGSMGLNVFDPDCFKSTDARIPELGTRRVVDDIGVLTQNEVDALTARIDEYEAASHGQMAVLLIRSLHGDAIEEFSLAVAEKWKIGRRGEDNGVLLLLAMEDRESRLEIGYGLEGVINDARAGDILRDIIPFMRNEQYARAISFVVDSVSALVLHENGPEAPGETLDDEDIGEEPRADLPKGPDEIMAMFVLICILIEIFGTVFARIMIHPDVKKSVGLVVMICIGRLILESLIAALKGGGSGGGSRGGGSSRSGGGGGGFGGGGASGRW